MNLSETLQSAISIFLEKADFIDFIVISTNLLLFIFARKIFLKTYHLPDTDPKFRARLIIFRALTLLIIVSFSYYHLYLPEQSKTIGFRFVSIFIAIYLSYMVIHVANYFIHLKYGYHREVDGTKHVSDSYNSRLISIVVSVFIGIVALISIIRILGFESWLEAGGVIGFIGVFLALTQSAWVPDLFSGLIILNSRMAEVGDVIEFKSGEKVLGVVFKTKVFHTEILNLVNNHRIMIKNSRLRESVIHNLSKFASARGLREQMQFNISYDVPASKVRNMIQKAFEKMFEDDDVAIESQHPPEIGIIETGDFAVQWVVYYYTKNIRQLLRTRLQVREHILKTSIEHAISLATPMQHQVETQQA